MKVQDSRPYHHGDLRRVLLEVGHRLLEETGAGRLSLRGIAREAGVSRAAPYHHFADREALLAAIATDGFRLLRKAMVERAEAADVPPLRKMQEIGVAYVLFAVEHPQLYRLMFGGQWHDRERHNELNGASAAAFRALGDALAQATRPATEHQGSTPGSSRDGDPDPIALGAWSLVHGLAMLILDGRIGREGMSVADVEELARRVTHVLGRGMAGAWEA